MLLYCWNWNCCVIVSLFGKIGNCLFFYFLFWCKWVSERDFVNCYFCMGGMKIFRKIYENWDDPLDWDICVYVYRLVWYLNTDLILFLNALVEQIHLFLSLELLIAIFLQFLIFVAFSWTFYYFATFQHYTNITWYKIKWLLHYFLSNFRHLL